MAQGSGWRRVRTCMIEESNFIPPAGILVPAKQGVLIEIDEH